MASLELKPRRAAALGLLAALAAAAAAAQPAPAPPQPLDPARVRAVRAYVHDAWRTLTRSVADLPAAARDPKFPPPADGRWPVYVSAREDLARVNLHVRATAGPAAAGIVLRALPGRRPVPVHGLLYLPRPYVVPGGRFNEMYGWDSYFILRGLLRDGETARARDLVDNFVYEVEHYRTVLNANRTYYLTRSQPPFLSRMVLEVFARTGDRDWLRRSTPAIDAYYRHWDTPEHAAGTTGLARYWDHGEGPAPEVVAAERDASGRTHYERVREFYRTHPVTGYELDLYYDRARDRLTDLFYKGDRSMRESGFDPSDRFGPFSVDIIHHAPVCLNALLFRMEMDRAEIARALQAPAEARDWESRAARRRAAMDRYLWDEAAGLYFDYDFRRGRRSGYEFAATFHPLWAGAASAAQAGRVRDNLRRFEAPGGLLTSTRETGSQWDAPFGWAPLQVIAVEGLRRHGFHDDASRIARKFVTMVIEEFEEHGAIVEKYDVVRRQSDVAAGLRFGYTSNEIGFGWTNAAVVEFLGE